MLNYQRVVALREGERPFFGEQRAHGTEVWDGRMRGGELARSRQTRGWIKVMNAPYDWGNNDDDNNI